MADPGAGSRLALGIAYRGGAYHGWQSQPDGQTVQDALERALSAFAAAPVATVCAGRTDAGVHALNQVVHIDAPVQRDPFSWVRGTNRFLPSDMAVQWCQPVDARFHARNSAHGRRYRFVVLRVAGAAGAGNRAGRLGVPAARCATRCAAPLPHLVGSTTSRRSAPPAARPRRR